MALGIMLALALFIGNVGLLGAAAPPLSAPAPPRSEGARGEEHAPATPPSRRGLPPRGARADAASPAGILTYKVLKYAELEEDHLNPTVRRAGGRFRTAALSETSVRSLRPPARSQRPDRRASRGRAAA